MPIVSGVPEYRAVDGRYPPGVALPVAEARLHVADVDETKPVRPGDQAVAYTVSLKAGRTQLQTWFYDAERKRDLWGLLRVRAAKVSCGTTFRAVRIWC